MDRPTIDSIVGRAISFFVDILRILRRIGLYPIYNICHRYHHIHLYRHYRFCHLPICRLWNLLPSRSGTRSLRRRIRQDWLSTSALINFTVVRIFKPSWEVVVPPLGISWHGGMRTSVTASTSANSAHQTSLRFRRPIPTTTLTSSAGVRG